MINQTGHILVVDDHSTNRLKLSVGLKKQGDMFEAEEYHRLAPEEATIYWKLKGGCHYRLGEKELAVDAWRHRVELARADRVNGPSDGGQSINTKS